MSELKYYDAVGWQIVMDSPNIPFNFPKELKSCILHIWRFLVDPTKEHPEWQWSCGILPVLFCLWFVFSIKTSFLCQIASVYVWDFPCKSHVEHLSSWWNDNYCIAISTKFALYKFLKSSKMMQNLLQIPASANFDHTSN